MLRCCGGLLVLQRILTVCETQTLGFTWGGEMNLFIFGDITTEMTNQLIRDVVETKDSVIYVYINSEGGLGDCDYAIYEALRLSGKRIVTHAVQNVCSAAVTVYLAGDERYATNKANFMIHEAYHVDEKDSEEVKNTTRSYKMNLRDLRSITDSYFKLICSRSTLTMTKLKNYVHKAPNGDWTFGTALAKKYGIVHKVGFPMESALEISQKQTDLPTHPVLTSLKRVRNRRSKT
jgi:ATP-dependent protease ClpP protease subunit